LSSRAFTASENAAKLTLRQVVESAIRQVVGKNSMDYILIGDRAAIADSIKEKSQELLDVYAVGLLITTVNMKDVQPPEPVQAAFSHFQLLGVKSI
jgi:membrane protease subunit HflK